VPAKIQAYLSKIQDIDLQELILQIDPSEFPIKEETQYNVN
jgi:uncharacterized UBP type Zn finger protein